MNACLSNCRLYKNEYLVVSKYVEKQKHKSAHPVFVSDA